MTDENLVTEEEQTSDPGKVAQDLPGTLKRRRTNMLRLFLVLLFWTAGMIMFVVWYKNWPQKMDCARTAKRLTVAIDNYRATHQSLPAFFDEINVKPGRFNMTHYEYRFLGFGGPANLPDGTVVAHCAEPHKGILHESGRYVIRFLNNKLVLEWMTEPAFQQIMDKQKPLTSFYRSSQPMVLPGTDKGAK